MKYVFSIFLGIVALGAFGQEEFCRPEAIEILAKEIIDNLSKEDCDSVMKSTKESSVKYELFMAYEREDDKLIPIYDYLGSKGCTYLLVDNLEEVLFEYTYYKMHNKDTCMSDLLQPYLDQYFERIERTKRNLNADSIDGIYIPRNLEECFLQIDSFWNDSVKSVVKAWSEDEFVGKAHHSFGMWIRNNWGLWGGSRLSTYFQKKGIYHPDDMSGIILTSYHRYLKNEPIKLKKQIRYYKFYWSQFGEDDYYFQALTDTKVKYTSLDSALAHSAEIVDIDLSGYDVLPRKLKKFVNLRELSIDNSPKLNLEKSFKLIGQFEKLEKLSFFDNGFKEYPESLGGLELLSQLWIDGDSITELPNSIGNLQGLKAIMVSNCIHLNLEKLINQLALLPNLVELNLEENKLSTLPPNITKLSKLKQIDLSDNNFKVFPSELIKMDSLENISLFQNDIDSLDFKEGDLPALKQINLCYNSFKIFPMELARLVNLKRVWMWHCRISEIPDGLEQLKQLEQLDLSSNPLSKEDKLRIESTLTQTKVRL